MGIPRHHKETSIYDPSTTIEGGIADAAGRVERYVTDISDGGIWVTPRDAKPGSDGNPVPATRGWRIADAIELFRGAASVFKVWADTANTAAVKLRLGREDAGHVLLDDGGMDVLDGSGASLAEFGADGARVGAEDGAHVEVLSNALEILVGAVSYIRAGISGSASSVRIGKASAGHVTVTDSGLDVTGSDGSTSVASFGATARVGKASAGHLDIGSDGNAVFTGTSAGNRAVVGGTSASYDNPGLLLVKGGTSTYELRTASATPIQEAINVAGGTAHRFPRFAYSGSTGFAIRQEADAVSLANMALSGGTWNATEFARIYGNNSRNLYFELTGTDYRFMMTNAGNLRLDAYSGGKWETEDYFLKRSSYLTRGAKAGTVTNNAEIGAGSSHTFTTTVTIPDGYLYTGVGRIGRTGTGSTRLVLQGFNTNSDGNDVEVVGQYRNVGTSAIAKGDITFYVELCYIRESLVL